MIGGLESLTLNATLNIKIIIHFSCTHKRSWQGNLELNLYEKNALQQMHTLMIMQAFVYVKVWTIIDWMIDTFGAKVGISWSWASLSYVRATSIYIIIMTVTTATPCVNSIGISNLCCFVHHIGCNVAIVLFTSK